MKSAMQIFRANLLFIGAVCAIFLIVSTAVYAADNLNVTKNVTVPFVKQLDKTNSIIITSPVVKLVEPTTPHFQKGSFAYSMGNDAIKVKDFISAIKHWKASSHVGNFYADWQLAKYYLGHYNSNKNDKAALKYLRLVVSQYNISNQSRVRRNISADAMVELAMIYKRGSKTAKIKINLPVVLKLLKLASSSVGHAQANYMLGELYFTSKYMKAEKKRAITYYTLAARKNNLLAQIKLGNILYKYGRDLKVKTHGLAWLFIAKRDKSQKVTNVIDTIISKTKNTKFTNNQNIQAQRLANQITIKFNL